MPNVIARPRTLENGRTLTQFTDTTSTSVVTYTYPTQQTGLQIENSGEKDITVTVGSYTQTIKADTKWKVDTSFTSFSISSVVDSQEFIATSFVDVVTDLSAVSLQLSSLTSNLAEKAAKTDLITTNNNVAVKADKTYVDNEIAKKASGAPKGVYATLSALQTALPTGSPDNQLVTVDGKWYYWSGSAWTAGGIYQSTGIGNSGISKDNIAEKIITKNKLSSKLQSLFDDLLSSVSFTFSGTGYINTSGTVTTGGTAQYATIPVTPGDRFIINGVSVGPCRTAIAVDGSGNVIAAYPDINYGSTTNVMVDIVIPNGAITLYVNKNYNSQVLTSYQVTSHSPILSIAKKDLSDNLKALVTNIYDTLVTLPYTSGKYLNNTGAYTTNASYSYAIVPVNPGDNYAITGNALGNMPLYAFLNIAQNMISCFPSSNPAQTTLYNRLEITIPNGCYFLLINNAGSWDNPSLYSVSSCKVNSQKVYNYSTKKGVFMGDSLTDNTNNYATKRYYDLAADDLGFASINMGHNGTGYKRDEGNSNAFYQRILNIDTTADFCVIFGSGNDCNLAAMGLTDFGTATDTGTATVGGCINTTLDNFYSKAPLMKLGIMAPTPWSGYDLPAQNNNMQQFTALLQQICTNRGIPFLDLYHNSGLRPSSGTMNSLFNENSTSGNVHPNDAGHKFFYPQVREFIKKLL